MREIKFRGKRKDNGEWVYGNLQVPTPPFDKYFMWDKNDYGQQVEVIPETVGQFTGLKDKNKKDVYEGDVLRKTSKEYFDKINFVGYEVFYHDNDMAESHVGFQMNRTHYFGCVCGTSNFYQFLPKYVKKMEVIRTIHDAPPLK